MKASTHFFWQTLKIETFCGCLDEMCVLDEFNDPLSLQKPKRNPQRLLHRSIYEGLNFTTLTRVT